MQPTHIYCSNCEAIQPANFEPLTVDDETGCYLGGDIACTVCGLIIATLYRPKPASRSASLSIDGRFADGALL
jgi:hypothetical protein